MSRDPALGSNEATAGADRIRARSRVTPPVQANNAKQDLWPELEKLGEARVRELLSLEIYRGGTRFYVEEWLRYKEFPRAREALQAKPRAPANATNRVAIVAAGTIAAAAFLAHWAVLD